LINNMEMQDCGCSSRSEATIVPVILSGGGGSRLWPLSTSDKPKQFLPLLEDGKTLVHEALRRVHDRKSFRPPIVIANRRHADLCEAELSAEGEMARLILEPCGRNTAAAIATAALVASEMYADDCLLLVMPSDQIVDQVDEFHRAVSKGVTAALQGHLVTFGIRPTGPETGYGYLQIGPRIDGCEGVAKVARFVEKPKLEIAKAMVAAGDHLWNAGIFLFRASAILKEAERLVPSITNAVRSAVAAAAQDGIRLTPEAEQFAASPSESIDNAVMEHASNVAVVPMAPGWSDLGSWDALADIVERQAPIGPVTALECDGCYIRSDGLEIAALGLNALIIAGRITKPD
jgi:mannose-1-phosphate guanylyltransferase